MSTPRVTGAVNGTGAGRLGSPRVHLRSTDSTNERLRALAIAGAPHGTLVTASEQTAGRGRQGRRWSAPAGSSVLMSLLLRDPPKLAPLIAALATSDAADEALAQARGSTGGSSGRAGAGPARRTLIKWPNDVVVELPADEDEQAPFAKLAGILLEARLQEGWAIVGIGMNVAVRLEELPEELRPGAATQRPAATLGLDASQVEPTLERIVRALEARLAQEPRATLEAWRERDALYGREIAWGEERRGRARGIDGEGRLLVELAGGRRTALGAGEVHLAASVSG